MTRDGREAWSRSRRFYRGADQARAVGVADLRAMARRRLPAFVMEYLEGGAEDEVTLSRNREIFERYCFEPAVLRGVGDVDLSAEVMSALPSPLVLAPVGFCGLFWRDGDIALARAAADAGAPYIQSTASNAAIEAFGAIPKLRHWFQLYFFRDRGVVEALVARAARAKCEALVLTVDSGVYGKREWDARAYRKVGELNLLKKLEVLRHPRWMGSVLCRGLPGFGNLEEFLPDNATILEAGAWARSQLEPAISWSDVAWLRSIWKGKLVLKGVMRCDDVASALKTGIDGVVLSNHGGRQLDGARSPMDVLPKIAAEFGGQLGIMVDGGFRRGGDVVKAIALGADAVLLGRAAIYGLAASGQVGVVRALTILKDEMRTAMALIGARGLEDLRADLVSRSS